MCTVTNINLPFSFPAPAAISVRRRPQHFWLVLFFVVFFNSPDFRLSSERRCRSSRPFGPMRLDVRFTHLSIPAVQSLDSPFGFSVDVMTVDGAASHWRPQDIWAQMELSSKSNSNLFYFEILQNVHLCYGKIHIKWLFLLHNCICLAEILWRF